MWNALKKYLISTGVLLFSLTALADPSQCTEVTDNLVDNCGWETGCWHAWRINDSIVAAGDGGIAHSGDWGGIVHPHVDIEYMGQGVSTVVGQAYTLSFWVRNLQSLDRFQVLWIDGDVVQYPLDLQNVPAEEYTQFVIPDLIATSDGMEIYWGLGNSLGDINFDDVVLAPQ